MSLYPFPKPPLTVDEQIDLLIHRGMSIPDRQRAHRYLSHINYYRLRAYWLPFEVPATDDDHQFRPGTHFDDVLSLYVFDRELRLLLIDAIERFEISLRTRWAQHLALTQGPFAHTNPNLFAKADVWRTGSNELAKEFSRSRETFAEHYRTCYPHLPAPPIWVACELMTLGHLSRWLQNLKAEKDRQAIANAYGLDERVLVSFAHHLTIVRNHCAHHGRIWNRRFSLKMRLPTKKPSGIAAAFYPATSGNIYNTLTMLAYLLSLISPSATWPERVERLLAAHPQAQPQAMGFPMDWETRPMWSGAP